jgi:hypothetical protein
VVVAPGALLRWLRRGDGLLHVKRFELGGEAVQEDGRADDVRHLTLCGLGDVVPDGVRDHRGLAICVFDDVAIRVLVLAFDLVFVQPGDGVDVGEAHERTRWLREGGVELFDQRLAGFVLQEFVHRVTDLLVSASEYVVGAFWVSLVGPYNRFNVVQEIVEGDEPKLGFEMRVFAQVATSVAWMGEGHNEHARS